MSFSCDTFVNLISNTPNILSNLLWGPFTFVSSGVYILLTWNIFAGRTFVIIGISLSIVDIPYYGIDSREKWQKLSVGI